MSLVHVLTANIRAVEKEYKNIYIDNIVLAFKNQRRSTMPTIREQIDYLVQVTDSYDSSKAPQEILDNIDKWKWGEYGWTSPASLIFTATWRNHFYPDVDCCKIWAKDEKQQNIEGGYSIRSEDESITIPILSKYDLCTGYCSPNSGMQGSRAIEKMRNLKRINIDFDSAQRTLFDLKLFATILNQINELNPEQSLEVLKYQILIAKRLRQKRLETDAKIQSATYNSFSLLKFLSETADPELTKCVFAACFKALYPNFKLEGVEDFKTAADARAQKPGDLSLYKDETCYIAIEVKDKTQTIDWNNIDRAKKILNSHPSLTTFIFALESRSATTTNIIQEMVHSPQLQVSPCDKIIFMSLHDIFRMALAVSTEKDLIKRTGQLITIAPAIKPETKASWLKNISK